MKALNINDILQQMTIFIGLIIQQYFSRGSIFLGEPLPENFLSNVFISFYLLLQRAKLQSFFLSDIALKAPY